MIFLQRYCLFGKYKRNAWLILPILMETFGILFFLYICIGLEEEIQPLVMKEKIDFSEVPTSYAMCLNRECPKADTCLRQIAEQIIPSDIERWTIISPKFLASLDGACPHYRSSKKVRYAKGFLKILENLPHNQMRMVISQLTGCFGRRTFYRVRKGERLLSPDEQRMVLNVCKNCGATSIQEFDSYIEDYSW